MTAHLAKLHPDDALVPPSDDCSNTDDEREWLFLLARRVELMASLQKLCVGGESPNLRTRSFNAYYYGRHGVAHAHNTCPHVRACGDTNVVHDDFLSYCWTSARAVDLGGARYAHLSATLSTDRVTCVVGVSLLPEGWKRGFL